MSERRDLDVLVEAFARNGDVNGSLLGDLTEPDLALADPWGGWNVGQHVGHVIEFRYGWLSVVAPGHAEGIPSVADVDADGAPVLTTRSLEELAAAAVAGDAAVLAAVREANDAGRAFTGAYAHGAHLLVHTIVHDAHHRGQIMRMLRASGGRTAHEMAASDEAFWPVWHR